MITTKLATHDSELEAILALQRANLRRNLSEAEAATEGFLIAEYDLDYLRQMHDSRPSIIAVEGEQVVGYALVATQSVRAGNALLADLFDKIDQLEYRSAPIKGTPYVVVGQVCVAKGYRGIGLIQRMYEHFRDSLQEHHCFAITDVARANHRSLRAHLKTGFQVIHAINFEGLEWDVILWDWTQTGTTQ